MKYIKIGIILVALFFINVMVVSAGPLTLGDMLRKDTIDVDGITYKYIELRDKNMEPQKIFYADFLPGPDSKYEMVLHHIETESDDYLGSTVRDIALDYESKTNQKVMVAVNGDFFAGDHTPVGYYIVNGEIYRNAPNESMHEFGFDNLGNGIAGNIQGFTYKIILHTNNGIEEIRVNKYNSEPSDGEVSIFEPSVINTMNVSNAGKYIVQLNNGENYSYPINGSASRLSQGNIVDDSSVTLLDGQLGICIKGDNEISQLFYNNFLDGIQVEIMKVPDGDFYNMPWVIGGRHVLVDKGTLLPFGAPAREDDPLAPRTTIGVTNEGKYFVEIIDGRQSGYSRGITIAEQGQLAYDLGAYSAVEIDGGGSSTFYLRINDVLTLMNKPSDTGNVERKVSNAVLIVEKKEEPIETTTTEQATTTTEEITTTTEVTTTSEQTTTTTEEIATTTEEITTTNTDLTTTTEKIVNSNDEEDGFNVLIVILPLTLLGVITVSIQVLRRKR